MKQSTLNKFIVQSSSDSDISDEEYLDTCSKVKKSEIQYWTKVQSRSQLSTKNRVIYNINEDLASLRRNKLYKREADEEAKHFMFDIDDYPVKQENIKPEHYTLSTAQL